MPFFGRGQRNSVHKFSVPGLNAAIKLASHQSFRDVYHEQKRVLLLKNAANEYLRAAEDRLCVARNGTRFPRPVDADWSWRPETLRGPVGDIGCASAASGTCLGHELKVFHDCPHNQIALCQLKNDRKKHLAPFGLGLDVLAFEGSFLSLALDLPSDAVVGLTKRHILRMDCVVEGENEFHLDARLNLQHGPNSECLLSELKPSGDGFSVEFDLAYMDFNENRAEKFWVDLLVGDAKMNRIIIRDITFNRIPRAEM